MWLVVWFVEYESSSGVTSAVKSAVGPLTTLTNPWWLALSIGCNCPSKYLNQTSIIIASSLYRRILMATIDNENEILLWGLQTVASLRVCELRGSSGHSLTIPSLFPPILNNPSSHMGMQQSITTSCLKCTS